MIGTFHFSSPGSDMVKIKHLDVMDGPSQSYLEALTGRIVANYKPTLILLEYNPENDAQMQEQYKAYQAGTYSLGVNENYQLGFRLGVAAGNVPIASYDERGINWEAEALFEVLPTTAPEINEALEKLLAKITQESQEAHQTLDLKALLMRANDSDEDRLNKSIYILTNSVSSEGKYEGATASSSWWHRNFRMYAKIQQRAKAGEHIIVIGGQGHMAILKDFLALDPNLKAVDVRDYF